MRAFKRFLCIAVLLLASHGCTDNKAEVAVTGKAFIITAAVTPHFIKFGDKACMLNGLITVQNVTAKLQTFDVGSLSLKINNELISRTFKESLPAEKTSSNTIELNANSSLSFPARWIYNVPAEAKVKSLQFVLQEFE